MAALAGAVVWKLRECGGADCLPQNEEELEAAERGAAWWRCSAAR